MSLPAFHAAFEGYARAHGAREEGHDTGEDEFAQVLAEEMAAGRA
jgi:hypothetical protein